jgi:VCBS repeat-containing protein
VSPDGSQVMVTDMADTVVRTLTLNRGNTAPQAGTPTVGTPNTATGTVIGAVNFTDPDGDTLTYTVPTQPPSGAVTVNAAGTYTYTPSQAARDAAAQTPGVDVATFTIIANDGQATTFVSITVPIAPSTSTPWLPIDMPTAPTDKVVFAHYVPWFPISPDNLPADQDYYTTQYLDPLGEFGFHQAYGGYLRDRPLPRDPINDPNWKYLDIVTEVNQAKSVGIDGFAVDIVTTTGQQGEAINNLLLAAQATSNFHIQPIADLAGPFSNLTATAFAAQMAPYLLSPGAYRLADGRVVLGSFFAENKSVSWWSDALAALHNTYGLNVAFVPTFLDPLSNMAAFAPISYGFSSWGGRNAVNTDPNATSPGSATDVVNQAHALGMIWEAPVAFQDNRPREGVYEESGNTATNSNEWQVAMNTNAEWVQLLTWNDYAENSDMAPSVDQGYSMLDMQAYNIAKYKYGTAPTVVRDAIYISNRTQFANATPTYNETVLMQTRFFTPAPTNTVDIVVFATAPATIVANIGGVISTCGVGGGRSVCSFPLQLGTISVTMVRNGSTQLVVTSPYTVTATPYVQDEQYYISGGLR